MATLRVEILCEILCKKRIEILCELLCGYHYLNEDKSGLKVALPTFDGSVEKFDAWRFRLKGVLHSQGLAAKVKTALDGGEAGFTNEEKAKLPLVYGTLISSLSGAALESVRGAPEDLVPALQALDARYNSQTKGQRALALRSLLNRKYDSREERLDEYVSGKINLMRERLCNTIRPDELVTLAIIMNLPPAYSAVTAPLLTRDDLTTDELKKAILEFDSQLTAQSAETDGHALLGGKIDAPPPSWSSSGSSSSRESPLDEVRREMRDDVLRDQIKAAVNKAMANKGKGKNGGKNTVQKHGEKDKSRLVCYKCRNKGHLASECKMPAQGGKSGGTLGRRK